ncbi:transcriptional regulator protein [Micromonospora robiginosa]|uniref:Transcriptional regulator protein n=1 Tax=Micromonospora robiginosa TaxID=2749844 RepID=A0A7L6BF32_9ACTN|nr:transcriptional regulator protein [Micromonospora ferruginea]QLQ40517.2 transcriptional regulator protein [Micromonospora ferruginea]
MTRQATGESVRPFDPAGAGPLFETELIPLFELGGSLSPRLDGENDDHARMLADSDMPLPPIMVHRATMRVIDGMHRIRAARLRGDTEIWGNFFDGTTEAAFVLAVKANVTHGLPLSLRDRTAAAEQIITSHPHWSDRAIGTTAGLSAKTVAGVRRRLAAYDATSARVGRDGRVRPLNSADGRLRVVELLREQPDAPLRAIAKLASVSPSTAWDVRNRVRRGEGPIGSSASSRATAPTLVREESPVSHSDVTPVLRGLARDPSLRLSASGRRLLQWLHSRAVRNGEWRRYVDEIPPHSTYTVADVARRCADEWLRLADALDRRKARSA